MSSVSFKTWDGTHYLCAEGGGGREVVANRTVVNAWELFEVVQLGNGNVAFQAANGQYLCAEQGGGGVLVANRDAANAWETFTPVPGLNGGTALRSIEGYFICAEGGGGGEVNVTRTNLGSWETLFPSAPLSGTVPPPNGLDRIDGQLYVEQGGSFAVAGRPVLPCFWHDGSLFSLYCNGNEAEALRHLDEGMAAGYHGERSWDTLDGSWWSGLHVNPRVTPNYWERKRKWLLEHKQRGLVLFDSRGSMFPDSIDAPVSFFRRLGELYNEVGPSTIAVTEWCNEVAGACPDDRRDPWLMRECMDVLRSICPGVLQAGSAYSGMPQPVSVLNEWSRDIYLQHSFRGFHWPNKLEHAFSTPYEDRPDRRQGINAEPPADGHWVSTTENKHELDTSFQVLLALVNWISRQGTVLFSSPGVRPWPGEELTNIPGWREVPAARALLPADVMRYSDIFHGGAERPLSPLRIIDAGSGRAEHALFRPDGRFAVVAYNQDRLEPFLRGVRVIRDELIGSKGRLITGQADEVI